MKVCTSNYKLKKKSKEKLNKCLLGTSKKEKLCAVYSLSRDQLFATPQTTAHRGSLSFTISRSLLKLMSIESVMPSNHLILCCPLLLLLSIFPASGSFPMSRFFASCGQSVGSFSFCISPSNEYSGLISFRIVWFDLLAVQGTLKSLIQHHSSKASILGHLAFFLGHLAFFLTSVHDCWNNHSFD